MEIDFIDLQGDPTGLCAAMRESSLLFRREGSQEWFGLSSGTVPGGSTPIVPPAGRRLPSNVAFAVRHCRINSLCHRFVKREARNGETESQCWVCGPGSARAGESSDCHYQPPPQSASPVVVRVNP